jgi:hypothetical protein
VVLIYTVVRQVGELELQGVVQHPHFFVVWSGPSKNRGWLNTPYSVMRWRI